MGKLPDWSRFEVDGEVFYWITYRGSVSSPAGSKARPTEALDVSRAPNTPGVGRSLPVGTVVTEEHARELVRLVKTQLGRFP